MSKNQQDLQSKQGKEKTKTRKNNSFAYDRFCALRFPRFFLNRVTIDSQQDNTFFFQFLTSIYFQVIARMGRGARNKTKLGKGDGKSGNARPNKYSADVEDRFERLNVEDEEVENEDSEENSSCEEEEEQEVRSFMKFDLENFWKLWFFTNSFSNQFRVTLRI